MKDRAEFEQRNLDLVEEAKLQKLDMQMTLQMRRSMYPGCPHRHGMPEGPDICDLDGRMHDCSVELGIWCETYNEYLEEWRLEYEAPDKADAVRGA